MSEPRPIQYDIVGKRPDSVGLFWEEPKKIKPPPMEKVKRIPPEPVWLNDDYLPLLDEALAWEPETYSTNELWQAAAYGERMVFDIENYPNYFLVMFKSIKTGKVFYFEKTEDQELATQMLERLASAFCIVGFNSYNYDIPMLSLAIAGASFQQLQDAQFFLINERWRPYQVLAYFRKLGLKVPDIKFNHIDLINVAPLEGSLKEYGGRAHTQFMQDLPFDPGKPLEVYRLEKQAILRYYCHNDLVTTNDLYKMLEADITLREELGKTYNLELRSKSDSQIAEAVIAKELERVTGSRPERQEIMPGTFYYYYAPAYLQYKTELLRWVLATVCSTRFQVSEHGNIPLPKALEELKININGTEYQMGIGGLHSCESNIAHYADSEYTLIDRDVTSYYPFIILNNGFYPEHLGTAFVQVYRVIVDKRLEAKRAGNKKVADSLKITINGTFGKLGNKWSLMYSPSLMLQVTITGQLSLLYLIEKIELAGIRVVSANTDGIVIKCPRVRREELNLLIAEWERETRYETEEAEYCAVLSANVNNYIAVQTNGKIKGKGQLGWGLTPLHKNPVNGICITAIERFLAQGIEIERTVHECRDFTQFVSVRKVTGGAVRDGVYLGKAIRWYYATGTEGEIIYAKSGNKVPRSENAKPVMRMPETFPNDINYAWYINEAYKMLSEAGYPVNMGEGS